MRKLQCQWEIPSLLKENAAIDQRPITITGHKDAMDCSTCAQYLKERWGPAGLSALALVGDAILLLVHNGQLKIETTADSTLKLDT